MEPTFRASSHADPGAGTPKYGWERAWRSGNVKAVLAHVSMPSLPSRPELSLERRGCERYPVWFPVQLDAQELGVAVGITKDASAKGLLLEANGTFAVGAPVQLTFRVSPHHAPQYVDATIVRADRNRSGVWPYRVAVEFDDPQGHLEPGLRDEARVQST